MFRIKKIGLFCFLSLIAIITFASFPVLTQTVITDPESEKFKIESLGFIVGILTFLLLPYSLLLLFIRKKNFRGSLAWGWLSACLLFGIILIIYFIAPEIRFLY